MFCEHSVDEKLRSIRVGVSGAGVSYVPAQENGFNFKIYGIV